MSTQSDFTKKLASDPTFANAIKGCTDEGEILATAKRAGINLSPADIAKSMATGSQELSDKDLESVTSGTVMAAILIK